MAKELFKRTYKSRSYTDWQEMDEDEAIYGSKDISLPNSIDDLEEEVYEAIGTLERALKYEQTSKAIEQNGWYYAEV